MNRNGKVEIGESHVVVYPESSSSGLVAGILRKETDERGRVEYLLLDRLVHGRHTSSLGDFETYGVFVTELVLPSKRKKYIDAS